MATSDNATSALNISEISDSTCTWQEWNEFVDNQSGASIYHKYEWKHIYEVAFGHRTYYLVAKQKDKIVGIFPLVLVESLLFGRVLCSLPFATNFCGPLSPDIEVNDALLATAYDLAKSSDVRYLEIRSLNILDRQLETSTRKSCMTIQLDADPGNLWSSFKSKHRNNIRRAYGNDVTVEAGGIELLDRFYRILSHSWRDLGTPLYDKRFFEIIFAYFGEQITIFVANKAGMPMAAAFNGQYKGVVDGMWAGSLPQARKQQINYVLYWEMIKHECEQGHRLFHLGRSTSNSAAENFKKKWGATSQQLFWQHYFPTGSIDHTLSVDSPKFKAAISLWKRLPLPIANAIGRRIAPSLP